MNNVTGNGINVVSFAGNICGAPGMVAPQYILGNIAEQGVITTTATQWPAIPVGTRAGFFEHAQRFTNSLHVKIGDVFGKYGGAALAYSPAVGVFASALALINMPIPLPLVMANALDSPLGNEPLSSGYLKVSDIHEIYYEVRGNPAGTPLIFLHGGPGSGTSESYKTLFNLEKYLVVFFDQRGAGKSRPLGEIRENTTWDLVEDIEKLRNHLNLGQVVISGTSWGSTLGIAYAETYPDNVSGMILCSVFMGSESEIKHILGNHSYGFGGAGKLFPEVFKKIALAINPDSPEQIDSHLLLKKLLGPDRELARKMAKAWTFYEKKLSRPHMSDEEIIADLEESDVLAPVTIEAHYMANGFFFEKDPSKKKFVVSIDKGQLWRNFKRIRTIPVTIVHGDRDHLCSSDIACDPHRGFPDSKLIMVKGAGHSLSKDLELRRAFIQAANDPRRRTPIMGRMRMSFLDEANVVNVYVPNLKLADFVFGVAAKIYKMMERNVLAHRYWSVARHIEDIGRRLRYSSLVNDKEIEWVKYVNEHLDTESAEELLAKKPNFDRK